MARTNAFHTRSQQKMLFELFLNNEKVTRVTAMCHYGIMNLTARISELRVMGVPVTSYAVESGATFLMQYSMLQRDIVKMANDDLYCALDFYYDSDTERFVVYP